MASPKPVKYLIVSAILTKRKSKVILYSFYRITCSILRPNDNPYHKRCTKQSVSMLFVTHTMDAYEDEAKWCNLGMQFCHRFHRTVTVTCVLH